MAGPVLMTRSSPIADMGPSTTLMPCCKGLTTRFGISGGSKQARREQLYRHATSSGRISPLRSMYVYFVYAVCHEVVVAFTSSRMRPDSTRRALCGVRWFRTWRRAETGVQTRPTSVGLL